LKYFLFGTQFFENMGVLCEESLIVMSDDGSTGSPQGWEFIEQMRRGRKWSFDASHRHKWSFAASQCHL
jgi:hypothetical protein